MAIIPGDESRRRRERDAASAHREEISAKHHAIDGRIHGVDPAARDDERVALVQVDGADFACAEHLPSNAVRTASEWTRVASMA